MRVNPIRTPMSGEHVAGYGFNLFWIAGVDKFAQSRIASP